MNEGLANQIIRKLHGLKERPEVSDLVKKALDNVLKVDDTRKVDIKTTDIEKPLPQK
jgi:hypothetical protein